MIVADTSVWIDADKHPAGSTARTLNALLDADEIALALPVRLELVAGVARRDRPALVRALSGLPLLRPSDETWQVIEQWIPAAADKGHRFGLSDLLIAALARRYRWSCVVAGRGLYDSRAAEGREALCFVALVFSWLGY